MQRKEFENRIKNLLPKAADDVVESWAAYATELDHAEKLTGKRILLHKKREKPDICGYACRFPGKCNSALCSDCPVAEAFFAERDGVELVYAI